MKKYIIYFIIGLTIYSVHFAVTRHGIYGDGNGYYAIAHTVFFQTRPDFAPIYGFLSSFKGAAYTFSRIFWDTSPTVTGVLNSPWLIGTSFFWLPSFFIVNGLTKIMQLSLDNFSYVYEYGCGISGIILVLLGLYFIEKNLLRFVTKKTAFWTVFCIFFGSQLFYYATFEPALSHQASFFLISYIIYQTFAKNQRISDIIFLGLSVGFLTITRTGELLIIFLPLLYFARANFFSPFSNGFKKALFFVFFAFLAVLPQLLFQKILYGSYFVNPYLNGQKGDFYFPVPSSFYNQLFSPGGGFFVWSPVYLISVIGFIYYSKTDNTKLLLYGYSVILYYLLIASWKLVPTGFGNRFFLSIIPLLAVGLAKFFKGHRNFLKTVLVIAVLWNMLLIIQFYLEPERMVKRKGLTYKNLILGQITVPLKKSGLADFLLQ